MKVAIAGAGIGGLTLALMLHERGIDVHIYHAVGEIRPLGAGSERHTVLPASRT